MIDDEESYKARQRTVKSRGAKEFEDHNRPGNLVPDETHGAPAYERFRLV